MASLNVLLDPPEWKLSYTLRITASHIPRTTLLTGEFGANMHAPNSEPDTEKVPCIEYLTLRCTAGLLPLRRGAEFPFITNE